MTLRFELPAVQVTKLERPEGRFARIEVSDLRAALAVEGRPVLPSESALLGLPPGTIASVRVIEETARDLTEVEGLELEPLGKSEFRPDGKGLTPVRMFYRDPAFYDGGRSWPVATAELDVPGTWRHQRVVPLRVQPFRVDPVSHAVRVVTAATIRVDFVREGGSGVGPGARTQSLLDGAPALPAPADAWEGLYRRGILNYEAARTFRTAPPVPARRALPIGPEGTGARTAGGFDPAEEWTVKVDTTGVWRVTYAQLVAKGFPFGVSTQALAMTRRTWTGNQTPPFVRVPVPILVREGTTGANGVFDGDDAIEFYGQSFTDREQPSDYRRRFSDADVYYVAVDPALGGPQLPLNPPPNLVSPPKLTSFPSFRRYEKRFYFTPYPRDTCATYFTWTDPFSDATFTDSLTAWTPDVDPTGTVQFRVKFVGVALSPYQHTVLMRWKRPSDGLLTPVATRIWGGKDDLIADTSFAASRIASGTNRLDWRGYSPVVGFPEGGPSGGTLSSYEVTYPRLYRAFQNRLEFNSGGAEGDIEIEIDNLTSAQPPSQPPLVWDVTDSSAVRGMVIPLSWVISTGGNTYKFKLWDQIPTGTRHRYFLGWAPPTIPDAAVDRASLVHGTPIWDAPGQPDLLIVTPEAFRAEAERLAAHRRTQGFDVLVAPESEIYDAFDGGRRSDWAIRRFFEYAFARWDSRFALLFGDASDDTRNTLALSDRDWIPSHTISGPIETGNGKELSASDLWFVSELANAFVDGPPCTNSEPDLYADMALGRLPVGSVAQAHGMVDKLIAYDTQDRDGAWRKKAIMLPDDAYSYGSFFGEISQSYCFQSSEQVFERLCDKLESVIKTDGGFQDFNVEQFRLREKLASLGRPLPTDPSLCVPLDPDFFTVTQYVDQYTRPQFLTDLGQGALLVNFQGHGSAVQLAHERVFQSLGSAQDVDFIYNEGKPFIFLSFSCHVNQFTFYKEKQFGDGLGENVLIGPQNPPRPSAGAIASYASTNFELLPSDPSGRTHLNVWLFRALFQDPPSEPLHGESGARVLLGEALTLGMANSTGATFGIERRAAQTYCLLGDPTMPIETGAPRLYATANAQPVNSGVRFQPGAPGDSIAFAVDLVDESRIDDLTLTVTGEGARAVDPSEYVVTPSFPDTAGGGAGRRYQLLWNARPQAKDTDFNVSIRDRGGLTSSFTLPVRLEAKLFANGQPINDGESGPTSGTYQYIVNSPAQLTAADFEIRVDGAPPAGLVITPAPTDSSRRLWVLSWPAQFATDNHVAELVFPGGATRSVTFTTSATPRIGLQNVYAFPSPFAKPPVVFNFTLNSDQAATVAIKMYTVSGSLVFQRVEEGVQPGYHQWVWDGKDAYGDDLANGAYLYNVIAEDDRGMKDVERGKLARVR